MEAWCVCLESDPWECAARRDGILYPRGVQEPCNCSCHDRPYDPFEESKLDDAIDAIASEEGR